MPAAGVPVRSMISPLPFIVRTTARQNNTNVARCGFETVSVPLATRPQTTRTVSVAFFYRNVRPSPRRCRRRTTLLDFRFRPPFFDADEVLPRILPRIPPSPPPVDAVDSSDGSVTDVPANRATAVRPLRALREVARFVSNSFELYEPVQYANT